MQELRVSVTGSAGTKKGYFQGWSCIPIFTGSLQGEVKAVVRFEDGTVDLVDPPNVQFISDGEKQNVE